MISASIKLHAGTMKGPVECTIRANCPADVDHVFDVVISPMVRELMRHSMQDGFGPSVLYADMAFSGIWHAPGTLPETYPRRSERWFAQSSNSPEFEDWICMTRNLFHGHFLNVIDQQKGRLRMEADSIEQTGKRKLPETGRMEQEG